MTGLETRCLIFLNEFGPGDDGCRFEGDFVMYSKKELEALANAK